MAGHLPNFSPFFRITTAPAFQDSESLQGKQAQSALGKLLLLPGLSEGQALNRANGARQGMQKEVLDQKSGD
jgi:hypothetical protein